MEINSYLETITLVLK